jgi:hypothetical protein
MCGLAEFSIPQESLGSQIANPQITNPQIANPQSATFVEDPQILYIAKMQLVFLFIMLYPYSK